MRRKVAIISGSCCHAWIRRSSAPCSSHKIGPGGLPNHLDVIFPFLVDGLFRFTSTSFLNLSAHKVYIVCAAGIVSGKEIVSLILGSGLRRQGWDVEFLTSNWGNGDFITRLQKEGFSYRLLRLGFLSVSLQWKPMIWTLDQLRYWPSLMRNYVKLMRAKPRAVIHTNWHHALLLAPFLDRHRDLYWSHEITPNSRPYRYVFGMIARRVAGIVCVSQAVANSFAAIGIDRSKLLVIYNGFDRQPDVEAPRTEPPLRLGIVGQIGAWKGHGDAFDALALVGADSSVVLKIFGKGMPDYVESLKRRATEQGFADRVEWRGFVSNQAEIYEQLDICIVPSKFADPLPTSAIEASGFGRPVICSAMGGLAEIVNDRETGIVVEPDRPDLLAGAIRMFARQPELIASMGGAARRRAETVFSSGRFVRQFIEAMDGFAAARRVWERQA